MANLSLAEAKENLLDAGALLLAATNILVRLENQLGFSEGRRDLIRGFVIANSAQLRYLEAMSKDIVLGPQTKTSAVE